MDFKPKRPKNSSVDGFIKPSNNRPPLGYRPERMPSTSIRTIQPGFSKKPDTAPTMPEHQVPLQRYFSPHAEKLAEEREGKPKKIKKKWSRKRKVLTSLLVIFLIGGGVSAYFGARILGNVDKVFHGNVFSDASALFSSTTLKGESQGRVNILLAGDSSDDPGHQGAQLTDSILLLSIDTKSHTAFLLSIPRDLWVYVPGLSSYQKINAANDVTSFSGAGYPSGGMGELEQIVQTKLGIPIDYYGLMDYSAFSDAVNAVGGVTINIQSPDPRGLYDPNTDIRLPNGPVTLDGKEALNLARARGDGYGSYGFPDSDFDRTEHQRQIFIAVAQKAKTIGVLANPIKVTDLFNAFGNNFQTDLSLKDVLRLLQITKGINLSNIQSYTFSSTLSSPPVSDPILTTYTDPSSGQEALIPTQGIGNYGQMEQYYQALTSNNPVAKEQPDVVVLNGSQVDGLAAKEKTALESKGYYVSATADASTEYPGTEIVNESNGAMPNSLKLLQQLYPGTTVTSDTANTEAEEAQGYNASFVVILGENWDPKT
jgi:polyisoprenyl-teichoic acid--peptidoglycan teichoic acid transferase